MKVTIYIGKDYDELQTRSLQKYLLELRDDLIGLANNIKYKTRETTEGAEQHYLDLESYWRGPQTLSEITYSDDPAGAACYIDLKEWAHATDEEIIASLLDYKARLKEALATELDIK